MPVVGVKVESRKEVCAWLDTGSSDSFNSKSLVEDLELKGHVVSYTLNTLSGEENVSSAAVDLDSLVKPPLHTSSVNLLIIP